jgi:hypothetical protein
MNSYDWEAENKRLRDGLSEVLDMYSTYQHLDAILSSVGGKFELDMLAEFWAAIKKAALAAKEKP